MCIILLYFCSKLHEIIASIVSDDDFDEEESQPDKNELASTLRTLSAKLDDLNTCNELISKHGAGLQRALGDIEQCDNTADVGAKVKSLNERATLFRITSNAMINVSDGAVPLLLANT